MHVYHVVTSIKFDHNETAKKKKVSVNEVKYKHSTNSKIKKKDLK